MDWEDGCSAIGETARATTLPSRGRHLSLTATCSRMKHYLPTAPCWEMTNINKVQLRLPHLCFCDEA